MPRSLSFVAPRKRLYPFQCPKMTACPCPPEDLQQPGAGVVALSPDHVRLSGQGQSGFGIGRKRVNEPLVNQQMPSIPRSDDGRIPQVKDYGVVRTVPIITEPKEVKQKGEGGLDLLPGDALKMKLIRKIACQAKKDKLMKAHSKPKSKKVSLDVVVEKLFPILLKQVDPKAAQILHSDKAKKALSGLKKILISKIKEAKPDKKTAEQIASVFIDVFEKMGRNIPDNAEEVLSNEILSALIRLQSGTFSGSGKGKNKQFWRDFGHGFKKAMKVGLPIVGVLGTALGQPEVALAAGLAEELL